VQWKNYKAGTDDLIVVFCSDS